MDVEVPRTRTGQFRPETLPAPYQRGYPEESQALWLGLLASSRSLSAARDALRKMGLYRSQQDLHTVAGVVLLFGARKLLDTHEVHIGARSGSMPSGRVPFHRGPTIAYRCALVPAVRVLSDANTSAHMSSRDII